MLTGAAICGAAMAQGQQYSVVDLGTFDGTGSGYAAASNHNGQATGWASIDANTFQAFFYSPQGGMTKIGNFASNPNATSQGSAINNSGMVVGYGASAAGPYHAFWWTQAAGLHDMGTFAGGTGSTAMGVNDSGVVVGSANTPTAPGGVAYTWTQAGGFVDIGGFTGPDDGGVANCINASGEVGGTAIVVPNQYAHGFVWTAGSGFTEIGDFDGGHQDSHVNAINDLGNAVGNATIPTSTGGRSFAAFYWTPSGGQVNLGGINASAPNDTATGINNQNQVVGWGYTGLGGDKGWIWTQGQGMRSLDSLLDPASAANWTIVSCQGINNDGVISAQAFHAAAGGGRFAAVLLTPVPEPSSLACLAGLTGWIVRRRARAGGSKVRSFTAAR